MAQLNGKMKTERLIEEGSEEKPQSTGNGFKSKWGKKRERNLEK